ncbi:hypothetical protein I316_04354 [Kwoniella heveanensis BCC8398]|uniref:Uncharacterized protein n=1 Tax=Kwoniella heveanensis BCC8398 TaxID=1296120 RepID=A0A1B9GSR0_9TREE|nr:hypothetical protein I316_04354 [Kwoniella heveanensis BCC8398]
MAITVVSDDSRHSSAPPTSRTTPTAPGSNSNLPLPLTARNMCQIPSSQATQRSEFYTKPTDFPESLTGPIPTRVFHTQPDQPWVGAIEYGTDDTEVRGLDHSLRQVPGKYTTAVHIFSEGTKLTHRVKNKILRRPNVDDATRSKIWDETLASCQRTTSLGPVEFNAKDYSEVAAMWNVSQHYGGLTDGSKAEIWPRGPTIVVGVTEDRSVYQGARIHLCGNVLPKELNYEYWDRAKSIIHKFEAATQGGTTSDWKDTFSRLIDEDAAGRDPHELSLPRVTPVMVHASVLDAFDSFHKVPPRNSGIVEDDDAGTHEASQGP